MTLKLPLGCMQDAVEMRTGVAVAEQRLIFGGRELTGSKTLEELNVHPKEVLHATLYLLVIHLVGSTGLLGGCPSRIGSLVISDGSRRLSRNTTRT